MKQNNKNIKRLVIFAITMTMCLNILLVFPSVSGQPACNPDVTINSGYDPEADCSGGAGAKWRNFLIDGNGWELAVGDPDAIGTYDPGWANLDFVYGGDYYFDPAGPNTFTYTYVSTTGDQTIEADVNGGLFTQTQNNGNLGTLNYLQLDVVARNGHKVEFNNVVLTVDGTDYNLCDFVADDIWNTWYIDSLDLTNGFTITGNAMLFGQAAGQEHSKISICAGYIEQPEPPEPSTVGGIFVPVDKTALIKPYIFISLAIIGLLSATIIYYKRR